MRQQSYILRSDGVRENVCKLLGMLNLAAEKPWEVVIRPYAKPRTHPQNAYYWKLLSVIGEHTGHDKDELHDYFRAKYLDHEMVQVFGKCQEKLRSTTTLKVHEFIDYLRRIIAFAHAELGINVPANEDYQYAMRAA